jgi:hypothetical protein
MTEMFMMPPILRTPSFQELYKPTSFALRDFCVGDVTVSQENLPQNLFSDLHHQHWHIIILSY